MPALSDIQAAPLSDEKGLGSLTLPGFIVEIAAKYADREALRWRDLARIQTSWTYAPMYGESLQAARALLATGVGRDTRVGLLVSNRAEWLFAMFGASMAGAVTICVNTLPPRRLN